jgi:hypothetical protein
MSNEEIEIDENLIKEFKSTEEYKKWQESLFAIIGYTSDNENDDIKAAKALIAEHLDASLQLQNGIEKIKFKAQYKKMREFNQDFESDLRGE